MIGTGPTLGRSWQASTGVQTLDQCRPGTASMTYKTLEKLSVLVRYWPDAGTPTKSFKVHKVRTARMVI